MKGWSKGMFQSSSPWIDSVMQMPSLHTSFNGICYLAVFWFSSIDGNVLVELSFFNGGWYVWSLDFMPCRSGLNVLENLPPMLPKSALRFPCPPSIANLRLFSQSCRSSMVFLLNRRSPSINSLKRCKHISDGEIYLCVTQSI